jgi:transcriptional regulator NrdR family protein
MICTNCKAKTEIIDSRSLITENKVRRRHRCPNCGNSFTTHESEVITARGRRRVKSLDMKKVWDRLAPLIDALEELENENDDGTGQPAQRESAGGENKT